MSIGPPVGSTVKRIVFLAIILVLVIRAHGKTTSAVRLDGAGTNHAVLSTSSGSNFIQTAGRHFPSVTTPQIANEAGKGVANLTEGLLEMSEPESLLLLGTTLLCIVWIRRRLPNHVRDRHIKIKSAWQVVSGFFF